MKKLLKTKLIGNAAIYALANILNGVIPFLLLPILTRVFTPEEYGLVTLMSAVIAIMGAFTGLSVQGAVSVKYFDKEIDHPKFVGASMMVLAGSTCFVLVFLLIAGDKLSQWTHLPKQWLIIAAIASVAQFVINIRLTMWQVKEQAIRYGFFQVTQTLFNLSLSLALVFWMMMGWEGRAWGIVIAALIFASFAIISLHKEKLVYWRGDKKYAETAMRFGVPLIPHVIGGLMMALSDRLILSSLLDLQSVGHYSVGIQMSMVIGVLGDAVAKAYGPYLYRTLANNSCYTSYRLVKLSYLTFLGLLVSSMVYILILPILYNVLIGKSFIDSLEIAQVAALGFAFQGMYYTVAGFLFYKNKTKQLSMITICCGIFNFLILFWFVSHFGILGASFAMLITWVLFFMITWMLVISTYRLPWFEFKRS